jgi:antitoxin (DNA-binding transcriptional repressor) of toxin-antitoxin stability system
MARKKQVNLYEAKTHLSQLVKEAGAGATIIIAKDGDPMAQLVPLSHGAISRRVPGKWAGKGWIADDFDAPLPADIQAQFDVGDADPRAPLRGLMDELPKR